MASSIGLSTHALLPFATGSRAAARRAVAANLFAGAALYVSPDYAKNAAKSLAKFPATSLDAKRIKAVQVRLLGHTAQPCITSISRAFPACVCPITNIISALQSCAGSWVRDTGVVPDALHLAAAAGACPQDWCHLPEQLPGHRGLVHAKRAFPVLQGISTAIWLDRIAAIQGGAANGGRLGLTQHFDAAAKQAAAAKKPVVVQIVVYDLPSRCLRSADGLGAMSPLAWCV